jgi:hypothetical protein
MSHFLEEAFCVLLIVGCLSVFVWDAFIRAEEQVEHDCRTCDDIEASWALPASDPRVHVTCPDHGEICVVASERVALGEVAVHRITCHGGLS